MPIVLALTATATPRVQDDIIRLLGVDRAERIITGFNRSNLISGRTAESKMWGDPESAVGYYGRTV